MPCLLAVGDHRVTIVLAMACIGSSRLCARVQEKLCQWGQLPQFRRRASSCVRTKFGFQPLVRNLVQDTQVRHIFFSNRDSFFWRYFCASVDFWSGYIRNRFFAWVGNVATVIVMCWSTYSNSNKIENRAVALTAVSFPKLINLHQYVCTIWILKELIFDNFFKRITLCGAW